MDIAVDPLEGTNLCATGAPNSITVLAASEQGGLLHAPDLYMEKIIVGPILQGRRRSGCAGRRQSGSDRQAARSRRRRSGGDGAGPPRHEKLISDIRAAGARIRLIGDGDLSAGISAAVIGTGVHVVMGIGGAPEGVLTAAALRCLNGEILARLVVSKTRASGTPGENGNQGWQADLRTEDLAPGKKIIFACTGVTDGNLLHGVRFFGEGIRTPSLIVTLDERQVRFVDTVHLDKRPDIKVRFN